MTDLVASRSPFIDGAFVTGAGEPFTITDPGTEEIVATVEGASLEQVADAIAAARRAFDSGPWPRMTVDERCDALLRFADAIEARRDVLVETVIAEAGCPLGFTQMMQVGMGLASSRDLVGLARSLPEWEHNELPMQEYVAGDKVKLSIRRYEPVGVVERDHAVELPLHHQHVEGRAGARHRLHGGPAPEPVHPARGHLPR